MSSVLLRRLRTVYVAVDAAGKGAAAGGLASLEAALRNRGFVATPRLRDALAGLEADGLARTGRELLRRLDAELGADRTHIPLRPHFADASPVGDDLVDAPSSALQPLERGTDLDADAARALAALLARRTPPTPQDREDLDVLLAHVRLHASPALDWLPDDIPVRETKARVLAALLRDPGTRDAAAPLVTARLTTATDVLRLLAVLSGGEADLLAPPRFRSVPRALRRRLLGVLDGLDAGALVEDVLRYPAAWKRAAEILHPFECHARYPKAALAFAVLRETDLDAVSFGPALRATAAEHPTAVRLDPDGRRVRPRTWRARVEEALRPGPGRDKSSGPDANPDPGGIPGADASPGPGGSPVPGGSPGRDGNPVPAGTPGRDGNPVPAGTPGRDESPVPAGTPGRDGNPVPAGTPGRDGTPGPDGKPGLCGTADPGAALALLAERPGELVRALDRLLRLYGPGPLPRQAVHALLRALPGAAPGPLLAALGRLRNRHLPGTRRVFFPRGQVTRAYAVDDDRAPLPRAVTEQVCGLLEGEALRRLATRAERADRYRLAVLDADLAGIAVPSAEGAAARALSPMPRGSFRPLPEGEVLRLFLHWTQPESTRVDLDLSVLLYDADWTYKGLCDYTRLMYGKRAAVHSGDLTSAPAPDGATEYVDLDLAGLADAGVRFVVPIVFSFNDVPFEQLLDAFAGFMTLHARHAREGRGAAYDPRTVRQRYDLVGDSRIHVPMLVDLERRTSLWTDVHLPSSGGHHSADRHRDALCVLGADLFAYFTAGRTTLWDVAVWHAATRAEETVVLRDGELLHHTLRLGETLGAYARRIRTGLSPDRRHRPAGDPVAAAGRAASGKRVLLALADGGVAPEGATGTVYRLLPGPVDGCGLEQATAADLVAGLA
ncbi:hypothetical protein [Streptomyces sp. TRM64462]|uniref:hypothetical protein n=1 Tax=Streptomyces sp. TRM64462 TaxID=2741726 RepID=UPI001586DA90